MSFTGTCRELRSILMSMRAFPTSRLEVISPAVAARQKQSRNRRAIAAALAEQPTIRERSIASFPWSFNAPHPYGGLLRQPGGHRPPLSALFLPFHDGGARDREPLGP